MSFLFDINDLNWKVLHCCKRIADWNQDSNTWACDQVQLFANKQRDHYFFDKSILRVFGELYRIAQGRKEKLF